MKRRGFPAHEEHREQARRPRLAQAQFFPAQIRAPEREKLQFLLYLPPAVERACGARQVMAANAEREWIRTRDARM